MAMNFGPALEALRGMPGGSQMLQGMIGDKLQTLGQGPGPGGQRAADLYMRTGGVSLDPETFLYGQNNQGNVSPGDFINAIPAGKTDLRRQMMEVLGLQPTDLQNIEGNRDDREEILRQLGY